MYVYIHTYICMYIYTYTYSYGWDYNNVPSIQLYAYIHYEMSVLDKVPS